jgi:hypothetical protein
VLLTVAAEGGPVVAEADGLSKEIAARIPLEGCPLLAAVGRVRVV